MALKRVKLGLPSLKSHLIQLLACATTVVESMVVIDGLFEKSEKKLCILMESFPEFRFHAIIFLLGFLGLVFEIWNAISDYRKDYGRIFADDDKTGIDEYLTHFIETGESVAVLSHDMSWIDDANFEMLKNKAKRKELLLFLPAETENVKQLKELGADVRYFGSIINDPAKALIKSRMTVVNWNKAFPKLTYPIKKDGWHINHEVPAGEPANQLALDLIQLLILTSQNGNEGTM